MRGAVVSLIALVTIGWVCSAARAEEFAFYHENVMGTSLELRVLADEAAAASWAEERVLAEIDRLSAIFSGYDRSSEFSRWQARQAGPVKISSELFELLQACDSWRTRTRGAFDPRVQVLTQLWSLCAKENRLPSAEESSRARDAMSRPAWRLDAMASSAERLSDCPLTLNAIAKGYIVERACQAALRADRGVRGLLLNIGGDLRVCGAMSGTIGIASPSADSETSPPIASVDVRNRAVATSGSSHRGLRINGKWYSHIFEPRSGQPAAAVRSATVIAERSADADALATALNVLSPDEGVRLVGTLPGVDCLIIAADGRIFRSPGWPGYERAPQKAEAARAVAGKSWGDEYELVIHFEISRPEVGGGRYRRPYIAVWVENKDGFPVRNLALWLSSGGAAPYQWLPDLKRWYRSDEARRLVDKTNLVEAISRPTRPPGKYTVIWDGKDDKGQPVAPGQYTIFIDAAREHGTYQNMRKPVTIGDRPFSEELAGGVEIRSATIEYRAKGAAK